MRTVAAIPSLALLAGSAAGLLLPLPPLLTLALLVASGAVALRAWRGERVVLLCVAVAAGFFAGGARLASASWEAAWNPPLLARFNRLAGEDRADAAREGRRLPIDDEAFAVVEGELRADAARTATGVSLSLEAERTGILATVVGALAPQRMDEWRAGRRVRLPIALRRPSRYFDPGVPDHERALARSGTRLVGTVKSGALVDVVARGWWAEEWMGRVRAFARRAIAAAVGPWSPRSAAIVAAIVIGDRAGLDPDVERRLQDAGTYHVIAISGGNIAILAGLLVGAFRLAGLLGRAAMVSAIGGLVWYGWLVGGGASVDRATLMAVVYFAGRAADQRSPPLNSLALVAACLVMSAPLSVADPAFVLTFGATLAILWIVPLVPRGRLSAATTLFAASAATEALLFPVGALVFARVTFAGLALNFAAIPLMAVAQIAGMAIVPAALVSTRLASAAGGLAHLGAEGLVRSADLVRFVPVAAWRVAPPNPSVVIVYYVGLGGWWTLWRRRGSAGSGEWPGARKARLVCVVLTVAAALWILAEPWAMVARRGDGRVHATFIDVGQGDAAFIRCPHGETMLVDAGGLSSASSFDIGDRVVAPVLRDAGVSRLDLLVLTHGDPDHVGGAPAIVREFRPREVWEGIPVPRDETMRALQEEAGALGLAWEQVTTGARRRFGEVEVAVWHPPPADWERQRVRNDDSIVIDVRWRAVSFVLTGDIGRDVERGLRTRIPRAPIRIVKVPHHGSLTSSTEDFVRALAPGIAVVSAGRANHFGHPVPEVLRRYEHAGATIFRTDLDGAVTVTTDGRTVEVSAFTGRRFMLRE